MSNIENNLALKATQRINMIYAMEKIWKAKLGRFANSKSVI